MLLVLVMLSAAPVSAAACEPIWQKAWKAWLDRELKGDAPPKTPKVPNAVELIHKAFLSECAAFTPETVKCARGEQRDHAIAELKKRMAGERAGPNAIAQAEAKFRASWTVLECREVEAALERAGDRAGADAGL